MAFEVGIKDRSVVIEFDSAAKAIEAYESPAYQAAKKLLEGTVERDVRILERSFLKCEPRNSTEGNRAFAAVLMFSAGASVGIVAGDFDHNGALDVVSASQSGNVIAVISNTGAK
jgi:hypothetical protein